MVTNPKEKDSDFIVIDRNVVYSIQNSIAMLDEKFDLRWKHQDMQFKCLDDKFKFIDQRFDEVNKKIEKLDGRFWQMIIILVSYPVALLIGKLCHAF